MLASSETPTLVVFSGGFSASWAVVAKLLDLESRGARFVIKPDGGFRVVPASLLTPDDVAFLREHLDEARRVVRFQADDSRLEVA